MNSLHEKYFPGPTQRYIWSLLATALFLAASVAIAQNAPYLVKDITPGMSADESNYSAPRSWVKVDESVYFIADSYLSPSGLWKTATTDYAVSLGVDQVCGIEGCMVPLNGQLVFMRRPNEEYMYPKIAQELWITEGTEQTTRLLAQLTIKTLQYSDALNNCYKPAVFNNEVYFCASDGTHGDELWKTDGTAEGTVMLKDICPGESDSTPQFATVFGSRLFFYANDGTHGYELWSTDGTEAGTSLLTDICPGSTGTRTLPLTVTSQGFFFFAEDGVHGTEIWKSDGTAAGTAMVVDYVPGSGSIDTPPTQIDIIIYPLNDHYCCSCEGTIFVSDGTPAGTFIDTNLVEAGYVAEFQSDIYYPSFVDPGGTDFAWKIDGQTLSAAPAFNADDEAWLPMGGTSDHLFLSNMSYGWSRLYAWDGASASPQLIYEFTDGNYILTFSILADRLYFRDKTNGELWISDGTQTGTHPLNAYVGTIKFDDQWGIAIDDGEIYFRGAEVGDTPLADPWNSDTTQTELWYSNSFQTDARLLKDIYQEPLSTSFYEMTPVGNRVYFFTSDKQLWSTDGSPEGTVAASAFSPALSSWRNIVDFNDRAMTILQRGQWQLWESGGTPDTMQLHYTVPAEETWINTLVASPSDTYLFFTGESNNIWRSSGQPLTTELRTLSSDESFAEPPVCIGSDAFFTTNQQPTIEHDVYSKRLYRWGENDTSPQLLQTYEDSAFPTLQLIATPDQLFYIRENNNESCTELWVSDGTVSGARKLRTSGLATWDIEGLSNLHALGSYAVFVDVLDQQIDQTIQKVHKLCISDGTPEGTVEQGTFFNLSTTWEPRQSVGEPYFFFSASPLENFEKFNFYAYNIRTHELELLKDLTGQGSSEQSVTQNGNLYLLLTNPVSGPQLWGSDGTANGTRKLYQFSRLETVGTMRVQGEQLIFPLTTVDYGTELWAYDIPPLASATLQVPQGDSDALDFSSTGLEADFDSNSQTGPMTSQVYAGFHDGLPGAYGEYWKLSGLESNVFGTILTFSYTHEGLQQAGLREDSLALFYSTDGGVTWTREPSVTDPAADTIHTQDPVDHFSLWTIGPNTDPVNGADHWALY